MCAAQVDFMPVYAAHLREIIKKGVDHPEHYEHPLKGFKIVVDAGNGSGGFLASDVLAPLGADTSGARSKHPKNQFTHPSINESDCTFSQPRQADVWLSLDKPAAATSTMSQHSYQLRRFEAAGRDLGCA